MGPVDLSKFTSSKADIPQTLLLRHPATRKETDMAIFVVGIDSSRAQAILDEQQSQRMQKVIKGEQVDWDAKLSREQGTQLLVACTTGWANIFWGDEPLEFNEANATKLYEEVPAIREQVNRAIGDRQLFFEA